MQAPVKSLGIDVLTKHKHAVIARLRRLVSVYEADDGGQYHENRHYSQVHVATTMTEQELDHWLWKNNLDYIGVFEREKLS